MAFFLVIVIKFGFIRLKQDNMLKIKYQLLKERNLGRSNQANRETLEQIKRDIIAARSRNNQRIEDLVIEDIKRRHKEWIDNAALDTSQIDPSYNVLITDNSVESPFIISSQLVRIIRSATKASQTKESKARAIYDWIEQNIDYGKIAKGYINSEEVLRCKKAICAEMAFLYIAMARSVGLKSNFVSVDRDCLGERANHACAVVETERPLVFVDPAYHIYDVKHEKYHIWRDKEIMKEFGRSRRR